LLRKKLCQKVAGLKKTFLFLFIGVSNGTEARELGRYPSGNTLPISSYANFNHRQGSPAWYHASMFCLFTLNSYLDYISSAITVCAFSPISWLFFEDFSLLSLLILQQN
jgi:hypothetical protein